MRIAFILPSLRRSGPIIVAKDIVSQIYRKVSVDVYYFDDITELEFDCPTYKIQFSTKIDFDKYDIIHSHGYRPDKYIWKNKKVIKGKTVTTMHNDIRFDLLYTYNIVISLIFRWLWLFFIRCQDKVVVLSKSIMNSYYKKYIKKEKLTYIYNGRPFVKYSLIDEHNMNIINNIKKNKYKIIGANAGLNKRKCLTFIISVLPIMPDYVFIIIGRGKEKENLIKLAKRLGVSDRCYFLGYKNNATDYLQYYDVYAMPSITEGFGLALIEAAFAKKSCICSTLDVFKELYTNDEVTFCNPGDRQSLKNAIEEAYEERVGKGEKAYERTSENYTIELMGQRYLDLYSQLCKSSYEKTNIK